MRRWPNWSEIPASAPTSVPRSTASSDLERLAARIGTGRASPSRPRRAREDALAILPKDQGPAHGEALEDASAELEAGIELCPEVRASIESALVDDPPPVDQGRRSDPPRVTTPTSTTSATWPGGARSWIARYQSEQVRRTGINGLKVGENKVHGFYIEVTHAQSGNGSKIPGDFIRKQTVKNAERYITPELKEYEDKVRNAEDRANALEYELFITLRDRVAADAPRLVQAGAVLAQLDVLCGLAELAAKHQAIAAPRWSRNPCSRSRPVATPSSTS